MIIYNDSKYTSAAPKFRKDVVNHAMINTFDKYTKILNMYKLPTKTKYVLVHQGSKTWELNNMQIDPIGNNINGQFSPVDSAKYKKYNAFTILPGKGSYFKHKYERPFAFGQTHIYVDDSTIFQGSSDKINFTDVKQIVDYRSNSGKQFLTKGLPAIVIPPVVGISLLKIACNCPYVYTADGSSYQFTGTMFAGAVYKNMERYDYMPISISNNSSNEIDLKIANRKNERQFINLADLIIVKHSKNSTVIPDKAGNFHTITKLNLPLTAISDDGCDHLTSLSQKDNLFYSFNDDQNKNPLNSITLTFKKLKEANQAKLVLNAKNTEWSGYAYDQICQLMGEKHEDWIKKQTKKTAEELIEGSKKQGVPLLVYIKTNNGWEYLDYYNVVGSLASRDIVMPIDLSKITSDSISIMLKAGFMFWDIDQAGIDFSADEQLITEVTKPILALDSLGNDHFTELASDDTLYTNHKYSDAVVLKFKTGTQDNNLTSSVFLRSKGYYNRLDEYSGKPDYVTLNKVRKPGGFSKFSKEKYLETLKTVTAYSPR